MPRNINASKSYGQLYVEAAEAMALGACCDSIRRDYCRWPYGVADWLARETSTDLGGDESDPERLRELVVALLDGIRDQIGPRERYGLPDSLVSAICDALVAVGHDIGEFRSSADAEAAAHHAMAAMQAEAPETLPCKIAPGGRHRHQRRRFAQ